MHARRGRTLLTVSLVVALGVGGLLAPGPAAAAASPEQQVASLINAERARAGLPKLAMDTRLNAPAETWSSHLAKTKTFKHSTASWRLARINLYGWKSSGENIAAGFTSAAAVVDAWMHSAGHKANILAKAYKGIGVGYVAGGPYGHYWTVVFAVADPPIKKGAKPQLTGTVKVGKVLKARSGGWPKGTKLVWRWYRDGALINGATGSTYRLTSRDGGKKVQVKVAAFHKKYAPARLLSAAKKVKKR